MSYKKFKSYLTQNNYVNVFKILKTISNKIPEKLQSNYHQLKDEFLQDIRDVNFNQRLSVLAEELKEVLDQEEAIMLDDLYESSEAKLKQEISDLNNKLDEIKNALESIKNAIGNTDKNPPNRNIEKLRQERDLISLKINNKENLLNEFNNLTNYTISSTENLPQETIINKDDHIINQIYNSLKRFEGFGFVDPNYIASIAPFNILSDYVWHYDEEYRRLFTINSEIHNLLKQVQVKDGIIILSKHLLEETVENAIEKLNWIFNFLNNSLIYHITAIEDYQKVGNRNINTLGFSIRDIFSGDENEGITKTILLQQDKCDCLSCNYHSLNFTKVINKLQDRVDYGGEDNLEYAFGTYLIADNNYKTAFNIYKNIEKEVKGSNPVRLFLVRLNIKYLRNLLFQSEIKIIDQIKAIDLEAQIYNTDEFPIDKTLREYFLEVKEKRFIHKIQDQVDNLLIKVNDLRRLYNNGGRQFSGANLSSALIAKYEILYSHINGNYIIYDNFTKYKQLTAKIFEGLVISHKIPEYGLEYFDEFILTEAILHIPQGSLKKILENVDKLDVVEGCLNTLLNRLLNFAKSYYEKSIFSDVYRNKLLQEKLNNHNFRVNFTNTFANLFVVLTRLDISREQFRNCIKPLISFIELQEELAHFQLMELGRFIYKKGELFSLDEMMTFLRIAINRQTSRYVTYDEFIEVLSKSVLKFYPDFRIVDEQLIHKAIINSSSNPPQPNNFQRISHLANISSDDCKQILFEALEKALDKRFSEYFYEIFVRDINYDLNRKNYFKLYTKTVNKQKRHDNYIVFGTPKLTTWAFMRYVFIFYRRSFDFTRPELQLFTDLNDFESWILNPFNFDYSKFDALWLVDLHNTIVVEKLQGHQAIKVAIENELQRKFHPVLAELKYTYFK